MTLAHLRTQQARGDAEELFAAKWQLTRLLFQQGWSKKRIIVLFKVINWMMSLPEPLQRRYRQAVRKLNKEHKVEWIDPYDLERIEKAEKKAMQKGMRQGMEQGLERGLEQGLEQGLERGRVEGAALLLERQLALRFGPLPGAVRKRLGKASLDQLASWGEASLHAEALKQVFT